MPFFARFIQSKYVSLWIPCVAHAISIYDPLRISVQILAETSGVRSVGRPTPLRGKIGVGLSPAIKSAGVLFFFIRNVTESENTDRSSCPVATLCIEIFTSTRSALTKVRFLPLWQIDTLAAYGRVCALHHIALKRESMRMQRYSFVRSS